MFTGREMICCKSYWTFPTPNMVGEKKVERALYSGSKVPSRWSMTHWI